SCLAVRASAATPDEMQHDLAPVTAVPVLDEIDALPLSEPHRPVRHRDMQRDTGEHRLHMRGHVVWALDIMDPAGVNGREAISGVTQVIEDRRRSISTSRRRTTVTISSADLSAYSRSCRRAAATSSRTRSSSDRSPGRWALAGADCRLPREADRGASRQEAEG